MAISYDTPLHPNRSNDAPRRESDIDYRLLQGESIGSNAIPRHTARRSAKPKVIFYNEQGEEFGLNDSQLSKHLLLLGGIGSGKTNVFNMLIQSLMHQMTEQDIMFIFDTKGDFYREFYQRGNPQHIVIGNGAQYEGETRYWDIYAELRESNGSFNRRSELTAKELCSQLFADRGSESQPFFADASADLLRAKLCSVMRDYNEHTISVRDLTNAKLVQWLRGARVKEYFDMTEKYSELRSTQMYFGDPSKAMTNQALGVFGYISSMVNDLFVGIFGDSNGVAPFSMRQLVRERGKKVIFVEYDLSVGEVLSPIYRILFDLAIKEALSQRVQGSSGAGNVYFMIDEFKLLPNLLHIDDALNFGRSLGVKICAGIQSVSQLYDIYGEDRANAMLAGFMNSICFQTWDYSSRQYILQRFGENYSSTAYLNYDQPVVVQREGHCVEDWDILSLKIGEAFVNLNGERSFRYHFPLYRG